MLAMFRGGKPRDESHPGLALCLTALIGQGLAEHIDELVEAHRVRALSPDHPVLRGSALVRGTMARPEIRAARAPGSTQRVSGSTSTKTGKA